MGPGNKANYEDTNHYDLQQFLYDSFFPKNCSLNCEHIGTHMLVRTCYSVQASQTGLTAIFLPEVYCFGCLTFSLQALVVAQCVC